MRGIPWRTVALVLVGGILLAVAFLPDPQTQNLSSLTSEQLIEELNSDREAVRRAVTNQLVARSKTIVPLLEAAVRKAGPEQKPRLYDVLEELMLSDDLEVADATESALDRLMTSVDPQVSDGALQIIYSNATLRHARAMGQFLELGGQFAKDRPLHWPASVHDVLNTPQLSPRVLILDENWQGRDEGLRFINRLFPGEPIAVHVSDQAVVSEEGLKRLRNERGYLIVRHEQESCLGVVVDELSSGEELRVSDVVPNSPAAQAGLRSGDRIYEFDGVAINNLRGLREQSRTHEPGTRVELRVRRQAMELRVKLILGTDFRTGDCQCPGQTT
ncbi:PDZ domain-containing protein [bacterium]|nr:PDZ domain-containing protein [bacterium]